MDYATFTSSLRTLTRTTSTTLTDAEVVSTVNLLKPILERKIVRVGDGRALGRTSYTDLVAGQRQYEFPTNFIRMYKLEINISGTQWGLVDEIDFNVVDTPISTENDITSYFSDSDPKFAMYRNAFNIYTGSTLTDVSQGLRLYYAIYSHKWVTGDLSSTNDISLDVTSTDVGFPEEFHEVLMYKCSKFIKQNRDKPLELVDEEKYLDLPGGLFEDSLATYMQANRDRKVEGILPDTFNYGYNL